MNKFLDWLLAKEISNELGGGCLVAAIRWTLFIAVLLTITVSVIKTIW